MLKLPWNQSSITINLKSDIRVNCLEPIFPPPLSPDAIRRFIKKDLAQLTGQIKQTAQIVLILEDPSRPSLTGDLVAAIMTGIREIRGGLTGFTVVMAAGAHHQLQPEDICRKIADPNLPLTVHNCKDNLNLIQIGTTSANVPLFFNKTVVAADLRLSVSTINIHPLAGFSGGGKILLPGVAGLETIYGLHHLPPGKAGEDQSPMRDLINHEVVSRLPIHYSWHLISQPGGAIVRIYGGDLSESQHQAKQELMKLVSVPKPSQFSSLLLLGCKPFSQNLIGTFKSLRHIPALLRPGGSAVLFNEAPQGIGSHHWRNDPAIVVNHKKYYREQLKPFRVAVFSPTTTIDQLAALFPGEFILIKTRERLQQFVKEADHDSIAVLPYAPVTLVI